MHKKNKNVIKHIIKSTSIHLVVEVADKNHFRAPRDKLAFKLWDIHPSQLVLNSPVTLISTSAHRHNDDLQRGQFQSNAR